MEPYALFCGTVQNSCFFLQNARQESPVICQPIEHFADKGWQGGSEVFPEGFPEGNLTPLFLFYSD